MDGRFLTLDELEEIKTLLRIANYDWSNEFEKTGRTSLRGLSNAASDMYDRLEEIINNEGDNKGD